ncbi:MAG: hypothetical protein ACK4U0_19130 [Mesorhizobium sp.]
MPGILDYAKMSAAALAGAAVMFAGATIYNVVFDNPAIRRETRALVEAEARERAFALIEKRNQDNVEISTMDLAGLCRELGGQWVRDEARCD